MKNLCNEEYTGFCFSYLCQMFIEYENVSSEAKVWIYPSNRKFYPKEIEDVTQKIQSFIDGWKNDDEEFTASFQFLYNRFVIFFADDKNESLTTSDINEQVHFILALQQDYEIELLDKMNVCFKQGEHVQYKDLKEFKKLIKSRAVSEKTILFDNLVTTKEEFENYWEVPISESWYNRFLKK